MLPIYACTFVLICHIALQVEGLLYILPLLKSVTRVHSCVHVNIDNVLLWMCACEYACAVRYPSS